MVDRRIVYTGEIPLDVDVLQPQRNTQDGIGALAQAVIGQELASPAFAADGFALSATTPASLILNVGPGSAYAQGVRDQTAFGSLAADTTNSITLQGLSIGTTTLTFTPPGTGGFSTNYLVQVGVSVQDNTPVVLPYVNVSNPPVPWLGPNNTGTSQNTVRGCLALIQAKAGVAASSGTQVTPAPDPGFFGLYSVTVANGATALTSGNWTTLATAPFIPAPLMAIPQAVQSNKWTFAEDIGTPNALVVTLTPAPLAIIDGMEINVEKGPVPNSGPSFLTVNGFGPTGIRTISGTALVGLEMPAFGQLKFIFDGVFWQLQNVTAASFGGPLFDGDATGLNTYSISNLTPGVPAALFNRMLLKASFAAPNNGPSNLDVGLGARPIINQSGSALTGGEITDTHILSYKLPSTSWELLTPAKPPGALQQLAAPQVYFLGYGGASDANNGLTSGTSFATFAHTIAIIAGFNLNNFNVTVNCANALYNIPSSIILPSIAGSGVVNFIGNSGTPSSCTISSSLGSCLFSTAASNFSFNGFKFTCGAANPTAADPGGGVYVAGTGVKIILNNVEFGTCQGTHYLALQGAQIQFGQSAIIISGGLTANAFAVGIHAYSLSGGNITWNPAAPPSLTISAAVNIPFFARCDVQGLIYGSFSSITGAGNVTGQKYYIGPLSLLNTGTNNIAYLPGTIAGVVQAGGGGVYT